MCGHGLSGLLQSAAPEDSYLPDISLRHGQNNMAGISPNGRTITALNWTSSATEVWILIWRLPSYFFLYAEKNSAL